MNWISIIAIYALFWVMTAFVVLPFGVKNHHEMNADLIVGQDPGAPANFNPKRVLLLTTLFSGTLFAFYYLNYANGWIDRHSLDWLINGTN
jgi:predicted secreted protein